ncbi:unnamed protein product [Rotaria sp. Silwood2]|nr:unnamed protein product [Rotaria sp. Silwood2]
MEEMIDNTVHEPKEDEDTYIHDFDDGNVDLSYHHKVPLILQNKDFDDLTDLIRHMDLKPMMNEQIRQIACQDKGILLSIRHQLKRNKIVLRTSYRGHVFRALKRRNFKRKASNYIKEKGIYLVIQQLTGPNPEHITHRYLMNIVHRVETTLYELLETKCLNQFQYTCMSQNRAQVKLNYLYFVPELNKEDWSVRPIIICNNGPTMLIADYVSDLLWSIFDRVTHCQNFLQGADAVQALEIYAHHHHRLQPTTLFVTFTMDDLCNIFQHEEILEILEDFLHTYGLSDENFQEHHISIETILRLVRLVLYNQYFVYNNKLYRQMVGGVSGLPLTMALAYIYLYHCRPLLWTMLMNNTQEIFGRHVDEAFFTWSGSERQLQKLFDVEINHHSSTHLKPTISKMIHFDDVYISHNNGQLQTKVYHYPFLNQIALLKNISYIPICSNPKLRIRKAFIRAVRCCLNRKDFIDEYNHIEWYYYSHGFSTLFIQQNTQQFFLDIGLPSLSMPLSEPNDYENLRHHIIEYEQHKSELIKQRKMNSKNTFNLYYSTDMDTDTLDQIKRVLKDDSKKTSEHSTDTDEIPFKYKLIPYEPIPLSADDYLIDKRPPLRLLTLSESDIEDDNDSIGLIIYSERKESRRTKNELQQNDLIRLPNRMMAANGHQENN